MPKVKIAIEVDAFLKLLQESAWDRPSAFYELARYLHIKHPRELLLHPHDDEREYLRETFAALRMRVPRLLLADEWDT
jgi:hypothetical protein